MRYGIKCSYKMKTNMMVLDFLNLPYDKRIHHSVYSIVPMSTQACFILAGYIKCKESPNETKGHNLSYPKVKWLSG